MVHRDDAWADAQRRRFMRPDAHRYVRHDAWRFMAPDAPRLLGKDAAGYFWPEAKRGQSAPTIAEDVAALRTERDALLRMRSELAGIKAELKFRKLLRALKSYNPEQPRVPAGNPDGGQWTSGLTTDEEPEDDLLRLAQFDGSVTDADGNAYYRPGGHHEMPKGIYSSWDLTPETRKVLDQSTTGRLPRGTVRDTPEGIPYGNIWNKAHRDYNDAVRGLSDRFLQRNSIKTEQMTPIQAQQLLKEIRESPDPRIREFNANMRLLQRLSPFRRGRGTE